MGEPPCEVRLYGRRGGEYTPERYVYNCFFAKKLGFFGGRPAGRPLLPKLVLRLSRVGERSPAVADGPL